MDFKLKLGFLEMAHKFRKGDLKGLCAYDYRPQKSPWQEILPAPLDTATPEEVGIPSQTVEHFFRALEQDPKIHPHGALIIRRKKLVAEGYWTPYTLSSPHDLYSLSKTFTGTAIGFAVQEGLFSLDDAIKDFFPGYRPAHGSLRHRPITIRHLLTMSTGVFFQEAATVLEKNWVKAFLESECAFEPGTHFCYNSLNSYMLSALIKQTTGQGLMEYLSPRLFQPLDIRTASWDLCPMGVEKGGWGLRMALRDTAKLGLLYLNQGQWKERSLLSPDWIRQATQKQIATDQSAGAEGYGFQIWTFPDQDAYQFNGIFGQAVVVLPHQEMVIALNCGNETLFPSSTVVDCICSLFGSQNDFPSMLPANRSAFRHLQATLENLNLHRLSPPSPPKKSARLEQLRPLFVKPSASPSVHQLFLDRSGIDYLFEKNTASILPLVQQSVHTNFSDGVCRVRLEFRSKDLLLHVQEGDWTNVILVGLGPEAKQSLLRFGDEYYTAAAVGRFLESAESPVQLQVYITFVETPSTRILRLRFESDRLLIRLSETPSAHGALRALTDLVNTGRPVQEKIVENFFSHHAVQLRAVLSPLILGQPAQS